MPKVVAANAFRKQFKVSALHTTFLSRVAASRSIGLDRVDYRNFRSKLASELSLISKKVLAGTYTFTTYKQQLISRGAGKAPRVLSIPTIRDRLTQRSLCDFLYGVFAEARPDLPQQKIDAVASAVASGGYKHFVKIDLKDFYPSIDHSRLLARVKRRVRLPQAVALIRAALTTATAPENARSGTSPANARGVPQGLSISNVLAEIFMLEVDNHIKAMEPTYFRYVDDILILRNSDPEVVCNSVCKLLKGQQLSPHAVGAAGSKTKVGQVQDGLEFLGYSIRPGVVSVRESSLIAFEGSIVSVFTEFKHRKRFAKNAAEVAAATARFWWALNLKLTGCIYQGQRFGWVFYYSQINDISVLRRIDNTVRLLIARFGVATPPNPKRLLKSFYESRRADKSDHKYIPNYDQMTPAKMRGFLTAIGILVAGLPDDEVEIAFKRLIRHATRGLEKDVAATS